MDSELMLRSISLTMKSYLICIDSYEADMLKGRLVDYANNTVTNFENAITMLKLLRESLDVLEFPRNYTKLRQFSDAVQTDMCEYDEISSLNSKVEERKGKKATFNIRIIFRQNATWQGTIFWQEGKREIAFRSVYELLMLMDEAIRKLLVDKVPM